MNSRERFQQALGIARTLAADPTLNEDNVEARVAELGGISTEDLKGKRRTIDRVYLRDIACYFLNEGFGVSTTDIGVRMDGRDHSTIVHSVSKIRDELGTYRDLRDSLTKPQEQLYS